MTNKPMLSVDRELLSTALKADASIGATATELVKGWVAMVELRALLDKDVLESQYDGMTQGQAQDVSDGVDEILHGKPAIQKQGKPVAWLIQCQHSGLVEQAEPNDKSDRPEEWSDSFPVFRDPPAPVAVDAEILERFPEINFANYGQDEVEALQAWAFEAYEAIARLNGVKP